MIDLSDLPASAAASEPAPGTVTLVGGGPGDPELLTLAGLRALQAADVVLIDHLAPPVAGLVRPDARLIDVGKIPHGPRAGQEDIHALMIEHARAGRRVVRLKGGDPFVFGRGGEEYLACAAAGVPVRVIPGVSSAIAAPELAGIPVTHRSLSQGFTVVSGHVAPGDPRSTLDWEVLARSHTTLVILMGVTHLGEIAAALQAAGLASDTPAAVIARACHPDTQIVRGRVGDITALAVAAGIRPPAITVVGAVAGLTLAAPPASA